jgi:hypothetical protein
MPLLRSMESSWLGQRRWHPSTQVAGPPLSSCRPGTLANVRVLLVIKVAC